MNLDILPKGESGCRDILPVGWLTFSVRGFTVRNYPLKYQEIVVEEII